MDFPHAVRDKQRTGPTGALTEQMSLRHEIFLSKDQARRLLRRAGGRGASLDDGRSQSRVLLSEKASRCDLSVALDSHGWMLTRFGKAVFEDRAFLIDDFSGCRRSVERVTKKGQDVQVLSLKLEILDHLGPEFLRRGAQMGRWGVHRLPFGCLGLGRRGGRSGGGRRGGVVIFFRSFWQVSALGD
jgi:hypothetical protein